MEESAETLACDLGEGVKYLGYRNQLIALGPLGECPRYLEIAVSGPLDTKSSGEVDLVLLLVHENSADLFCQGRNTSNLLNLDRSWTENTQRRRGLFIRFTIQVTCGEEEPSRFVPRVDGEVFDFAGDEADEREVLVGRIGAYLVQRGRSFDEGESLFDAMDSIDQSVHDCYCALFDSKNDEWSASVLATYGDNIMSMDVLYIESIDLESQFKSTDITPILRETIATFGSHCGLVAHEELPENAKVWTDIGFRKLADSDFYTYAPELPHQESDEPAPSSSVSWANRVRRGRRRLG